MITQPRPITDEPVRGVIAPPWINSLPGIERMRLYTRRLMPATPFARLTGYGIGHVSTGSLTGFLKASEHLVFPPAYNLTALYGHALYGGASTAVEAGVDVDPVSISVQYFRPPRPQPGNFLGRARVLNASSVFVACSAEIEDPVGRLVGFATSQWRLRKVDPPPPTAPATIDVSDEAVYATPDPPDRPSAGSMPSAELQARYGGLELTKMVMAGELPPFPLMHSMGARFMTVEEGSANVVMPASEWFCSSSRNIFPAAIESLLNMVSTGAALTQWSPGQSIAGLEQTSHFLRLVPADGRELSARGWIANRSGNLVFGRGEVADADGDVVAVQSCTYALLDVKDRPVTEPERVLATLLFTDIVESTRHAERMGDANWRRLLGEHDGLVRRELGAHRGREVKTTGDGFLARFDSPAAAVRCARAIRDGVRRLHLEIRSGVHTGECEVHGTDLTGIAVNAAARIMSHAGPGEILVSRTVLDLATGSGLHFAERGAFALKGVADDWTLFAVED